MERSRPMNSVVKEESHSNEVHAKFSPSALKMYAQCPRYRALERTTKAATEGTKAHKILETILRTCPGWGVWEGWEEVMKQYPMDYPYPVRVRKILDEMKTWDAPLNVSLEQRIEIKDLTGEVITFGTSDLVLELDEKTVLIGDYKFGEYKVDDPDVNLQGYAYAAGYLQAHPEKEWAHIVFLQPALTEKDKNAEWVLQHTMHRGMLDFILASIIRIVRTAEADNIATAGDCCRFCKRQMTCEAVRKALDTFMDATITPIAPLSKVNSWDFLRDTPETWTPEERHNGLELVQSLLSWGDSVKSSLTSLAKTGVEIPGYTLTGDSTVNSFVPGTTIPAISAIKSLSLPNGNSINDKTLIQEGVLTLQLSALKDLLIKAFPTKKAGLEEFNNFIFSHPELIQQTTRSGYLRKAPVKKSKPKKALETATEDVIDI